MSCGSCFLPEALFPVSSLGAASAWLSAGGGANVTLPRDLCWLPVKSSPSPLSSMSPPHHHEHQSWSTGVCAPVRPGTGLLLSIPDSVLSTPGVSGKPMKQGPVSCTTQHPWQVAFLLYLWPGVWALAMGAKSKEEL